jgi:hypothetical protein
VEVLQFRRELGQVVLGDPADEATHGQGVGTRAFGQAEADAAIDGSGEWGALARSRPETERNAEYFEGQHAAFAGGAEVQVDASEQGERRRADDR